MRRIFLILFVLVFMTGCNVKEESVMMTTETVIAETENTIVPAETAADAVEELFSVLVAPENSDFVRVKDYIPGIVTDLKYSGTENFTGQAIYNFEDAFLRYGTVVKLKAACEDLEKEGLSLKIWDGFRPVSAQFRLWEICPDPTYVADPNQGYSNHSRGFAVDVTLVDSNGRELEMPTAFDDFSHKADRDYSDCTATAAANARLLQDIMEKYGLKGYWGEWWHFNDTDRYDVEACFDPGIIGRRKLESKTKLLKNFREPDSDILTIPAGDSITLLGFDEEYAMVEYWGYRGYVPSVVLAAAE